MSLSLYLPLAGNSINILLLFGLGGRWVSSRVCSAWAAVSS